MIMKKLLMGLIAFLLPTILSAQITADQVRVIHETDTVWNFGLEGINLYSRQIHRIDIAYPSKDPEGNPVELSGYIAVPSDIYSGEQPVDGILLYNHYTQLNYNDAPTRGYATGEDFVIANPLRPNYIVVCSDFYGFGITEGRGQWYCYGAANGQASIDCLLAARALLDERNISQGKHLVNAGYSSGGYDAIATQKVRDMYYRDQISFDKTFVGGLPFDLSQAYDDIIAKKDEQGMQVFGILMILDSYNTHANLGLDLSSMLKEPIASKFDEWLHSGNHSTLSIKNACKDLTISDVFKDTLLQSGSTAVSLIKQAMSNVALENDWEPDTTQNYFVFHLLKDETVPVNSDRALINFLSSYEYGDDGKASPLFKKSIIPEQTHLQTNFIINTKYHTEMGGIVYYLNLIATLAALPVLYYDGELNTHYADLVKGLTPMEIIHKLEASGIDLKKIVKERMGDGSSSIWSLMASLDETLQPLGLNTIELLQIADDSGLSLAEILQIYMYLTSDDGGSGEAKSHKAPARQTQLTPGTPDYYLFFLEDWLKANNVNIYEPNKH